MDFRKGRARISRAERADIFIEIGFRNFSAANEMREMSWYKLLTMSIVHAALKCSPGCGRAVIGDAVIQKLTDGSPIAVHDAAKAPFLAQDFLR